MKLAVKVSFGIDLTFNLQSMIGAYRFIDWFLFEDHHDENSEKKRTDRK